MGAYGAQHEHDAHGSCAHQKKCSSFSYFSRNMRRPPSCENVAWPGKRTRSTSGSGLEAVSGAACLTPQVKCTRPSWSCREGACAGHQHIATCMSMSETARV